MDGLIPLVVLNVVASVGAFAAIAASRSSSRDSRDSVTRHQAEEFAKSVLAEVGLADDAGSDGKVAETLKTQQVQKADAEPPGNASTQKKREYTDGLIRHLLATLQLDPASVTRPESHLDLRGARVVVVGDLQGQLQALYNMLLDLKVIARVDNPPPGAEADPDACVSPTCEWLDSNTYVVQCGDQIDGGGRHDPRHAKMLHGDLETLLFTDYMAKISGGRFVNILGNHEWWNVTRNGNYAEYVHWEDRDGKGTMTLSERGSLFAYAGVMGKILRRRHAAFRLNDVLFSHGGVTPFVAANLLELGGHSGTGNATREDLDRGLNALNKELDEPDNYGDVGHMTETFRSLVCDYGKPGHSMMWTRYFKPDEFLENDDAEAVPDALSGLIRVMGTGHNKSPEQSIRVVTQDSTSGAKAWHNACDADAYPSKPCELDSATGTMDVPLPPGHTALLASDVVDDSTVKGYSPFQYASLKFDGEGATVGITVHTYKCEGERCAMWPAKKCIADLMLQKTT